MIVKLLNETGWLEAIQAMRLSRQSASDSYSTNGSVTIGEKDHALILSLLNADDNESGDPHSVALRMVNFTFLIKAPLYWWKQMDRYCVGKTQASSSTMYNIMKRELTADDFCDNIDERIIKIVNRYIRTNDFEDVIANLPCGYLQERIVQFSLPTLRRILFQRERHKLVEWTNFGNETLEQISYPEFVFEVV